MSNLFQKEDLLVPILPAIAQLSSDVHEWNLSNLRRYDPAFKLPYSTSALNGPARVAEHLNHQNPSKMQDMYGMSKDAFVRLRNELGLEDAKSVTADEQLANFLLVVRKGASLRASQDGTQRAKSTESDYFQLVLSRLADPQGFYGRYVKMPTSKAEPHPRLTEDDDWKEFRACVGAIDGTRLPLHCKVTGEDKKLDIRWPAFRDRKGSLTLNTLAVCDLDLRFTFIAPGYEGSCHDGYMWTHENKIHLHVPEGRWLLADAGFALCRELLPPYRGVRYHLQEYRKIKARQERSGREERDQVTTKYELFNLRHSSCRMMIERAFGVLKSRFPVFVKPLQYSISVQRDLLPGLCALHNYLRQYNDSSVERRLLDKVNKEMSDEAYERLTASYPDGSASNRAKNGEEDMQMEDDEWEENAISGPVTRRPGETDDHLVRRLEVAAGTREELLDFRDRMADAMWERYLADQEAYRRNRAARQG